MNMFKKNGGFTLVELIVVIAILAILAGIAVPAYSGYISEANKAADVTVCDAIKTASMAAMATTGEVVEVKIVSGTTPSVQAKVGSTTYDLLGGQSTADTNKAFAADFQLYYGSTAISAFKCLKDDGSKATATTATWTTANGWVFS